uniref:Glucosylceramidase n=1 Tax=Romanomermis culicivorax TaxID=13658 RepID=A0A915HYL0_ROMCU
MSIKLPLKRMLLLCLFAIFLTKIFISGAIHYDCLSKNYGHGSQVCVCNSQICDKVKPLEPIPDQGAVVFTSTKDGQRLVRTESFWTAPSVWDHEDRFSTFSHYWERNVENWEVDFATNFQTIDGFGGAFTDAAGINIASLPESAQDHLLNSYFSPQGGIAYNMGRVPIASCDFSTSNYSYDDVVDDMELKHFALAKEDVKFKIPFLKKAIILSNGSLRLFGSAWSSPFWMKNNHVMQHGGTLLGKPGGPYYKAYANYLIRFLDEYEKRGIKFWSLTVVNEPSAGFDPSYAFQSLGFTAKTQRDFIKLDLGPALEKSGRRNFKLMIMDDNKMMTLEWTAVIMADPQAAKYVSHVAVHWYTNRLTPLEIVDLTRDLFPNVSFIGTEACSGWIDNRVVLGSWERAEDYAKDILKNLNHWYTGWVDWNMALDLTGGPNWVSNFVDSPIIVNASGGEFYKQPMFYALGHF